MNARERNAPDDPQNRRNAAAVVVLFAVAAVLALALLLGLPALSAVDPVSRNVMVHRMRSAFCEPRVTHEVECLHECGAAAGADYRSTACAQLPSENPTRADQQTLEMQLWDRSPCAKTCQTNWKTHSIWCAKGGKPGATNDETGRAIENVKLEAIDACIFEGATMALFDWKEARCRSHCPDSAPDGPLYLTSADPCMTRCLVGSLVEAPPSRLVRDLDPSLQKQSDYAVAKALTDYNESPTPAGFEEVRRRCRLLHTRATHAEPLEDKRVQETAFRDCVRAALDAP